MRVSTPPRSTITNGKTHDVFLIEDHAAMRRVLRSLIDREADLAVIGEAASAEEALERLPALAPDLLLVDLALPGASGLELIRILKRTRPDLRFLVVTGHTGPQYERAADLAGADGFVTKDDPDGILTAVRRTLDG